MQSNSAHNTKQVPLLLKTAEASRYSGIPQKRLRELADRGELKCVRMGTWRKFLASDLEMFVERLATSKRPVARGFTPASI